MGYYIARGRCGEGLKFPFTCSCDENCLFFSDCCEDFTSSCKSQGFNALQKYNHNLFTCIGNYDQLCQTCFIIFVDVRSIKIHHSLQPTSLHSVQMPLSIQFHFSRGPIVQSSCFEASHQSSSQQNSLQSRPRILISKTIFSVQNSYCLTCWSNDTMALTMLTERNIQARSCIPHLSQCVAGKNKILEERCAEYLNPVMTTVRIICCGVGVVGF